MPSVEMLKKLLEEFDEQEAHAREELNVISQQIEELEKRIDVSRKKLATIGHDRENLLAMKDKYRANGNSNGSYRSSDSSASSSSFSSASSASTTSQSSGGNNYWSAPAPGSAPASESFSQPQSQFSSPVISEPVSARAREQQQEKAEIEQLAEAAAHQQDTSSASANAGQASDAQEAIERFMPTKALVRASSTRLKAMQQAQHPEQQHEQHQHDQHQDEQHQQAHQPAAQDASASLAQINPFAIMGQQEVQPETARQPIGPSIASSPIFDWGPPQAAEPPAHAAEQPHPPQESGDYRFGLQDSAFATSQSANKSIEDAIAAAGNSPFFTGNEEPSSPFSMPMTQGAPSNSMFGQQGNPPQSQFPMQGKPGQEDQQGAGRHNVADLEPDDESDDPGKSINDALRGLFR